LAWFPLKKNLVEPILSDNVPTLHPMAPATPVHRPTAGASFTKAVMGVGRQHLLPQCQRASIWAAKLIDAGCLA
jgi:hypothetical protein